MPDLNLPDLNLVDAHCHLADPRLDPVRAEVIRRAGEKGVRRFIQGGVDPEDWGRQRALARQYPGQVFTCFGLHPWWVAASRDEECELALTRLMSELGDAAALGELGLDHSSKIDPSSYGRQERFFIQQLEIARTLAKPIVLHIVHAHERALEILRNIGVSPAGGLVHAFGGSREVAEQYVSLGLTLSVGGPLVRKGFERVRRAVVWVPLTQLVVESDSPDLPPPRFADGLNEPESLWDVAEEIARLKGGGVTAEQVLIQSRENLEKIFVCLKS